MVKYVGPANTETASPPFLKQIMNQSICLQTVILPMSMKKNTGEEPMCISESARIHKVTIEMKRPM